MAWVALGVTLSLLTMGSGTVFAESVGRRPAVIAVRVFGNEGVSPAVVESAGREAQAIFNRVGLDIVWAYCVGADRSVACDRAIGTDELIVRIVAARTPVVEPSVAMGDALVAPGHRHASFATIYLDIVQSIARRAMVDPERLLGRAIAHEIGHLLLNTNEHAHDGLMRAFWSQAEMRRGNSLDWRISEHQATMMKASLMSLPAPDPH
jgi:hypothetical protein